MLLGIENVSRGAIPSHLPFDDTGSLSSSSCIYPPPPGTEQSIPYITPTYHFSPQTYASITKPPTHYQPTPIGPPLANREPPRNTFYFSQINQNRPIRPRPTSATVAPTVIPTTYQPIGTQIYPQPLFFITSGEIIQTQDPNLNWWFLTPILTSKSYI